MSLRVFIRKPVEADWEELLSLHQRSMAFHFPWVLPSLSEEGCKVYIERCKQDDFEGLLVCDLFQKKIVGVVNLSQIFYRAFQNAYIGYYIDVNFAKQGLMSEGIYLAINYAFHTLRLHRIEANIREHLKVAKTVKKRVVH
jgi:[ribosomal protein S5]-alanine N-acetyltransferase